MSITRQVTDEEMQILEAGRRGFMIELDALVRKYACSKEDIMYMLIVPGVQSAVIFSDLLPHQQQHLLTIMLGGTTNEAVPIS